MPSSDSDAKTSCLVCGASNLAPAFTRRFSWLVRCSRCGLLFASPQPTDDELAEVYGPKYYETFGFDPRCEVGYRKMKQSQSLRLLQLVAKSGASPRLLDAGSALGDMVAAAQTQGWEAFGVELNPFAVNMADRLVPGRTIQGTLEAYAATVDDFDVVTCLEVIEHVRQPDEMLRALFRLLRPGGRLLLTTPDKGALRARLLGGRWYHFHRDHLWYFDRSTLTRLVRDAGYEIVLWRRARKEFNLAYILGILAASPNRGIIQLAAKAARRSLPSVLQTRLLPPIIEGQLLIAQRPARSQAVCTSRETPLALQGASGP